MKVETKEAIKNTGATFTPPGLADYLANKILQYQNCSGLTILDPSCGDGELLDAIASLLHKQGKDFSLIGHDLNNDYLSLTKDRLLKYHVKKQFTAGDFLELAEISLTEDGVVANLFSKDNEHDKVDVVIANPPYVRTQILGSEVAQKLSKKFGLKGRVDLYHAFLIAMTTRLKENGMLGVLTSNRYLSTKSGESIRKFLSENYEVLEVIDLGDTKLFNAAVLPAIFVGRKKKASTSSNQQPKFIKLYEEPNAIIDQIKTCKNVYDALLQKEEGYFTTGDKMYKKTVGILNYSKEGKAPWEMLNRHEGEWINIVNANSKFKVGDLFKVRVGIKTTADKVFISDSWENTVNKPEDELLKPLISQENIGRWGTKEELKLKILYPHYSSKGKKATIDLDNYPNAKKYFEEHEHRLRSRKYVIEAKRKWYEIWVPQDPATWKFPKLVFPDISNLPRFFFDEKERLVNGNCYWISAELPHELEILLLIQGVANSKLMTTYHDLIFNNKLYSGRRRYFTQYVEKYPMPDPHSIHALEIIRIVKILNTVPPAHEMALLEMKLEEEVIRSFGIDP